MLKIANGLYRFFLFLTSSSFFIFHSYAYEESENKISLDCSAYNKLRHTEIKHLELHSSRIKTYPEAAAACQKEIISKLGSTFNLLKVKSHSLKTRKLHRSYVGCFYYDPHSPSASTISNPHWVWAKNLENLADDTTYLKLTGYYEERFFFVTDKSIGMDTILRSCKRSIPKGKRLLDFSTFNSMFDIFSYRISYDPNQEYSLNETHPVLSHGLKKIVIFGDSLSDTGNLQKFLRILPTGVYWNGRFSNGPIWAEYLEKMFSYKVPFLNWAYGGSKTRKSDDPYSEFKAIIKDFIAGGMNEEVDRYLKELGTRPSSAAKNLYIVWSGGNNYLDQVSSSGDYPKILNSLIKCENLGEGSGHCESDLALANINKTVDDIIDALTKLYSHGARNFLVGGLPDMSVTPLAKKHSSEMVFYYLSVRHNTILQTRLADFKKRHRDIESLQFADIESYVNELVKDPSLYEFSNMSDACYKGKYSGGNTQDLCKKPHEYLFFDKIHPSTRGHCFLSRSLLQDMRSSALVREDFLIPTLSQHKNFCKNLQK